MKTTLLDGIAASVQSSINELYNVTASLRVGKAAGLNMTDAENKYVASKANLTNQIKALETEGYTFDKKGMLL